MKVPWRESTESTFGAEIKPRSVLRYRAGSREDGVELPGVMAANIIISLSVMAAWSPPFISPPTPCLNLRELEAGVDVKGNIKMCREMKRRGRVRRSRQIGSARNKSDGNKEETRRGELVTAAIICLLPHLSSSKRRCHHLLTSTP